METQIEEIREKYERLAGWYDLFLTPFDWMVLGKLRKRLLAGARGDVLEVAVGTGRNLPYYPGGCKLTAIDVSPAMLAKARLRAGSIGVTAKFQEMNAETLEFPDATFDTVVETLALCTFPDPVNALREMARVLRPGGRLLLADHGRSLSRWLACLQDATDDRHARAFACHWNREPLKLLGRAGLRPRFVERYIFGVFYEVVVDGGNS